MERWKKKSRGGWCWLVKGEMSADEVPQSASPPWTLLGVTDLRRSEAFGIRCSTKRRNLDEAEEIERPGAPSREKEISYLQERLGKIMWWSTTTILVAKSLRRRGEISKFFFPKDKEGKRKKDLPNQERGERKDRKGSSKYKLRSEQDPRRLTSTSSSSSSTTSVHVTALDGLVNVNSLFTIAVFVGLSLTTPGQHSLENRAPCDAGIDSAKKLLVFEVVSFSFFLFSSLVAQGLKLAINLLNSKDVDEAIRAHINLKVLRLGMMGSAVGSVMGCLFLMLSMVNVIEIRLGMLSCGSKSAVHSVTALVLLVSSALLVYISTAVYAFLH
ncbi:hypothetical protein Goshw_021509 [Gossypium schwendimanii]|uniref:Maternal effect embryo arrest protein n=2 Tax=Gossypium TaxID=3633 RepID=A0A7J9MWI9_GOSSC|nr:hypothetical protein [Gossypium schwendimanii]